MDLEAEEGSRQGISVSQSRSRRWLKVSTFWCEGDGGDSESTALVACIDFLRVIFSIASRWSLSKMTLVVARLDIDSIAAVHPSLCLGSRRNCLPTFCHRSVTHLSHMSVTVCRNWIEDILLLRVTQTPSLPLQCYHGIAHPSLESPKSWQLVHEVKAS